MKYVCLICAHVCIYIQTQYVFDHFKTTTVKRIKHLGANLLWRWESCYSLMCGERRHVIYMALFTTLQIISIKGKNIYNISIHKVIHHFKSVGEFHAPLKILSIHASAVGIALRKKKRELTKSKHTHAKILRCGVSSRRPASISAINAVSAGWTRGTAHSPLTCARAWNAPARIYRVL